jgi:CheY-like chemotaxis protein
MKRRALVVDDDRLMATTLGEILELKGWDVSMAYDGRAAVNATLADGFDVVVMDIKMPGMNGVEALSVIKAANPKVHVVLMTAYAAPEVLLEAERHGVREIVSKPLDIPRLLHLLAA